MKERKYFKHTESGEIYFEGLDQKRKINLINCNTGSEYYLPGQYGEHDFFPFEQIPAPSTPVDEVKDKHTEPDVIPEVLAEVREYTDLPIMLTDWEFAPNHLFCVRGKYCEFTELSKVVQVYVYPTYQKDKHTKRFGQKTLAEKYLEWVNDWLTVDAMADNYGMTKEQMLDIIERGKIEHNQNCNSVKDKQEQTQKGEGLPDSLILLATGTGLREVNQPTDRLLLRTDDATICLNKNSEFGKIAHALVDRYNEYPTLYRENKELKGALARLVNRIENHWHSITSGGQDGILTALTKEAKQALTRIS